MCSLQITMSKNVYNIFNWTVGKALNAISDKNET